MNRIHKLREQWQDVLAQGAERDGRRQRNEEMRAFLREQANESLVYDIGSWFGGWWRKLRCMRKG